MRWAHRFHHDVYPFPVGEPADLGLEVLAAVVDRTMHASAKMAVRLAADAVPKISALEANSRYGVGEVDASCPHGDPYLTSSHRRRRRCSESIS
jgi:hypothetical protein